MMACTMSQYTSTVRHRYRIPRAGMALATLLSATACWAQAPYPVKPVRVIVPFPPGAGVDIVTRIVTPKFSEALGQSFVVDNRAGAGGIIGTEIAARAPADGYNLHMGGSSMITAPLTSKVTFSARDFAPIARIASVPFILVVHPSMPVKTLADLVALARAKPGAINFASTGNWTSPHLTTELFMRAAKISMVHVPYKGSAPALTDLLGGHLSIFFCNMLSATPHVSSNRLRALAVSSAQRSPVTPQVPTVAESGIPGFEVIVWYGVFAPAGTPRPIISRLNQEIGKLAAMQDIKDRLAVQGAEVMISTPEELTQRVRGDLAQWGKIVRTSGIKAD